MVYDPVNAAPSTITTYDPKTYVETGGEIIVIYDPEAVQAIREAVQYAVGLFPVDTSTHEAAVKLSEETKKVEEVVMNGGSDITLETMPDLTRLNGDSLITFPYEEEHDRTELLLFAIHAYEIWLKLGPDTFDILPDYESPQQDGDSCTIDRTRLVALIRQPFDITDENRQARKHAAEELFVATLNFRLNSEEAFSIGAKSIKDGEF